MHPDAPCPVPHRRARGRRNGAAAGALLLLATVAGCPGEGARRVPYDPLPMDEAIALVNANTQQLQVTLKAKNGHARGRFTEGDGAKRHFDMDAALLVRPPRCLRLDLNVLGNSQLIFGSNASRYWVVQPAASALTWGRHDRPVPPNARDLIIRPDLIAEALGIAPLPNPTAGGDGPWQRITPDYQQLIFLDYDSDLRGYISKEYWLDRYDPQLVGRIIFRDPLGVAVLDARLSNYRPLAEAGPLLPRRIEIHWPATDGYMLFTCGGWTAQPNVDETHPGFAFPLDRGETFKQIVDIDVELNNAANPPPPPPPPPLPCTLDAPPPAPLDKPLLAVLDLDVPAAQGADAGRDLADACRAALAQSDRYVQLDRAAMISILGDAEFGAAAACSEVPSCADIGRRLSTQKLLYGSVVPTDGALALSLTLLDVSTMRVDAHVTASALAQFDRLSEVLSAVTCELLRDAVAGHHEAPEQPD